MQVVFGACFMASLGATSVKAATSGAVFTMTNDVLKNAVTMYNRATDGTLSLVGRYDTGGRGSGGTNDPLQSQNALVLTSNRQFLLAVNAGSSDLSVFQLTGGTLQLTSVTPSGGGGPISIASYGDLIYIVNYVGNYHTAGFKLTPSGKLIPVANSRQPLSTLDTGASTVSFNPDGSKLVVSERIANKVDVFTVNADGSISNPVYNASAGLNPFGLDFTPNGTLLVTETDGGPPNESSTSSYKINSDNTVTVLTAAADASGQAACWVLNNGAYAWVADSGSGNIGAFSIANGGQLTPIGSVASEGANSFPFDLGFSSDQSYFYVFYSGLGRIYEYSVGEGGSLVSIGSVASGVAQTGGVGLASY